MKALFLLPAVIVLVGCAEPNPRNLDTLVQQGEVYMDPETMEPYSGQVYEFDPAFEGFQDMVLEQGDLKDGLKDGPWEHLANGQVNETGSYSSGKREGPWESYHENGRLGDRGLYLKNEREGPWEAYYEDGELRSKGSNSNGGPCGEWVFDDRERSYSPCPAGSGQGD